jgi:hypothetical protein
MGHVVLLGDSIFDNGGYVPGRPAVIEQVRGQLPAGWNATLLAVDGDVTSDVPGQLARVPADATHFFVSIGGNDALGAASVLASVAHSVAEALEVLNVIYGRFETLYGNMLRAVAAHGRPTTLCTIYDSIPGLGVAERTALNGFNDVILRAAFRAGLPVIDLRIVCDRPDDYSHVSSIEPSHLGGAKIARAIATVVANHRFDQSVSAVYV